MNTQQTVDRAGLLAIIRQQIEIVLCQVGDAALKFGADGEPNPSLATGFAQLHVAAGALRMVQYPGAARFCSEIEAALKAALRNTPADKAEIATVGAAAHQLREFVNDVAAGGTYQPPRLYTAYRKLAKISGNDAASEKDLFFPELIDNAPAHANPRAITPAILPPLVKDLRVRYQRGLLTWLKNSTQPEGLKLMRDVLDQLHQIAAQVPEPRGVWWASVGLTEAVMELLPDAKAAEWLARVKPVFSRIDFLLRDLAAKGTADTAPAQRDVYYAIASCRTPTPRLVETRKVLNLQDVVADAPDAGGKTDSHRPQLEDARARLENIKEVWTEYAAGEPNRLARYRELLAPLTQKASELGNAQLSRLLQAIEGSTKQLPDPYPLDGQVMSLEMASALLMAESIVQHFNALPPDLDAQVGIMTNWLAEAATGKIASGTPAGLRADIVQKANDEKLRIATAREILKSLQQVEKAVEVFAADPAKRIEVTPLTIALRQVHGVFTVTNQKRAARLATACRELLERCTGAPDADTPKHIEWLAEGLGSLGFYLEPSLHGKMPAERAINIFFARYENQAGFEALLARSQKIAVVQTEAPATPADVTPAPAPIPAAAPTPPTAPGADREMLEIFLEEASEVLSAMEGSIAQARGGSGDALINIRRAFHTLKGSARMVGLTAFGECGWQLEQVMNHWLAQGLAATPELMDLCSDARDLLWEWSHALQGEAAPDIDASAIEARARVIRGEEPTVPVAAPPPATPVAAAEATQPATPTEPAEFMTMNLPAEQPAAPPAETVPAPAEDDDTAYMTMHMPAATGASDAGDAPAYQSTLADLGDRLAWLNGLVEEIQQQATASGSANPRLNEVAHMMTESMSEALALHQSLQTQLQQLKK
mgnify:CR=1 FL=1